MAKYANPAKARGICDRCGFAYKLSKLRPEYVLGRPTGVLTCPECWDADHPQNYAGRRVVTDAQALRNPRPEDHRESRRISWYERVMPAKRLRTRIGRFTVEVE